jgi:hypothetical protein
LHCFVTSVTTEKYQFHTRLQLKNQNIQVVDKIKILGTTFNNKITWDENCSIIVRKVNALMQLLRKVWSFGSSVTEMVHLWRTYCLSILEQSCVVWGNLLTEDNKLDLERTQKSFCKLVLEEDYKDYENALITLQLETLDSRRKKLTLNFAKTSLADGHFHDLIKKKKNKKRTSYKEKRTLQCNICPY